MIIIFYRIKNTIRRIFVYAAIIISVAFVIYGLFTKNQNTQQYSLSNIHFEVRLLENGDSFVREDREYKFNKGEFSRGFFDLEDGIEDIKIYENNIIYAKLEDFDANRPENSYSYKKNNGLTNLEWYYKAREGEIRTFSIEYKVKKTIVSYDDCAIYFQKFLSEKNETEIEKLTARIHLPNKSNSENTLIWGHGPSHGNLEFDSSDSSIVNFVLLDVPPGQYVEARFILDKEHMGNNEYISTGMKKNDVIEEETFAAKKADNKYRIITLLTLAAYFFSGLIIVLTISSRIKYK